MRHCLWSLLRFLLYAVRSLQFPYLVLAQRSAGPIFHEAFGYCCHLRFALTYHQKTHAVFLWNHNSCNLWYCGLFICPHALCSTCYRTSCLLSSLCFWPSHTLLGYKISGWCGTFLLPTLAWSQGFTLVFLLLVTIIGTANCLKLCTWWWCGNAIGVKFVISQYWPLQILGIQRKMMMASSCSEKEIFIQDVTSVDWSLSSR